MAAVNMPPNQLPGPNNNRMFLVDDKQQQQQQQQQQQMAWIPDERDSFISWLRSEFAAANAVIDAMCQHLQAVSSTPGEYDFVLNCVRQRRYNWSPVLNLQQYYSVEEVVMSLQQVAMKKRQMHQHAHSHPHQQQLPHGSADAWSNRAEIEADNNGNLNSSARSCHAAKQEDLQGPGQPEPASQPVEEVNSDQGPISKPASAEEGGTPATVKISKNFQSFENVDGRLVNVVEGLRVCENVFTPSESDQLIGTLKELQGRKVELGATGYKIVGGKRIFKAKSSESLQQPADNTDELSQRSSLQDETTESLPVTLQGIIDRLLECQILPASKRPDSYIVNFLGEGGYLPPQTNNQEFDQPFCIITLQSEYTMVFGRFISMDSPREFRSQFKLLLSVGSVLVFQGNSAKLARYAIPAVPTKRCCFVLGKSVSKRYSRNMGFQRSSSSGGLINRPAVGAVQTLSPAQMVGPAAAVSAGPGFSPGANSPAAQPGPGPGPFPPLPVLSPGWSPVVPRPGRLMSGTGVFLPYNASSSGPGRPNSNHRSSGGNKQGGPVLQKMHSLPASFRTQNGVTTTSTSSGSGKAVVEDEPNQEQIASSTSTSSGGGARADNAASSLNSSAETSQGSDEASSSSS